MTETIENITITLGGRQNVDVDWLHSELYRGLTAENYLKLYRMMDGKITFETLKPILDCCHNCGHRSVVECLLLEEKRRELDNFQKELEKRMNEANEQE